MAGLNFWSRPQHSRTMRSSVEPIGPAPLPPDIRILLRVLSGEDDVFVQTHGIHLPTFRADRRKIFLAILPRVKAYFMAIQKERRVHMVRSGRVDMGLLMGDDMAFTRALLELRIALVIHYVRADVACGLVRRACAEIEACLPIAATNHPGSIQPA